MSGKHLLPFSDRAIIELLHTSCSESDANGVLTEQYLQATGRSGQEPVPLRSGPLRVCLRTHRLSTVTPHPNGHGTNSCSAVCAAALLALLLLLLVLPAEEAEAEAGAAEALAVRGISTGHITPVS
jgi:hypothetical protein